jgi:hypothetical protein
MNDLSANAAVNILDARTAFQALQRAFGDTLAQHAGRASLVPALAAQAFDNQAGNAALQCEGEPPLACTRGCAACCVLRVVASAPEVFTMARFLRAVVPPLAGRGIDLIARLRAADASTRGLGEPARLAAAQPCPFLAQGQCAVYRVRSLACRGHASFDAAACRDAVQGRSAAAPHSAGQRWARALVQNALQSALRDAGLAWQLYELNHALLLAWADPQAEAAWAAGGDPLAAAAVDEVPRAEMAAVFEQLRPLAQAAD